MKNFTISYFDPLVTNVILRLFINDYLVNSRSGHLQTHSQVLLPLAYASVIKLPMCVSDKELKRLETHVEQLKPSSIEHFGADAVVLDNWTHSIRFGKEKIMSECLPIPQPYDWPDHDASSFCSVMLSWGKEDLSDWYEDDEIGRQCAVQTSEMLNALSLAQVVPDHHNQFMNMDSIWSLQMFAMERFIGALKGKNKQDAHDAITVLMLLSKLWFQLYNSMSIGRSDDSILGEPIQSHLPTDSARAVGGN
jgi:hypothetical protein